MPQNTLAIIIGKNISAQRRKLNLSQKELANKLQITQDAMARMEKGKIAPKMSRLIDISENLQCTVTYLFRTHDNATEECAATIADILKELSPEKQEALVELVANTARLMDK